MGWASRPKHAFHSAHSSGTGLAGHAVRYAPFDEHGYERLQKLQFYLAHGGATRLGIRWQQLAILPTHDEQVGYRANPW